MQPQTAAQLCNDDEAIAHIRSFLVGCSLEATRPNTKDAAILKQFVRPGNQIYISAVPNRPISESIDAACVIRMAGLEPVPHVAARSFASLHECEIAIKRLTDEAGVRTIMLIGGDVDRPVGALTSAHSIIESGLLRKYKISGVGLAGYPERHPRIGDDELEAALVTKSALAQAQGLDVHIVTQFGFDSKPILKWIAWLRARGIHLPVKVGLAGPTSISTWLSYARRCGVRASASALASRTGLVSHLFKVVSPDPIIRELSTLSATGRLVDVSAHMYSFGGIAATAQWVHGAQTGQLSLEGDGGFKVRMG
jgi:methylenetetrahydrofolate reductase (NADPH)